MSASWNTPLWDSTWVTARFSRGGRGKIHKLRHQYSKFHFRHLSWRFDSTFTSHRRTVKFAESHKSPVRLRLDLFQLSYDTGLRRKSKKCCFHSNVSPNIKPYIRLTWRKSTSVFLCLQTLQRSSVSLLWHPPLVVFNSLSSMRLHLRRSRHDNAATQRSSSCCLDYTGCHLSLHSVVSNSLLWRSGGCSNPSACTLTRCSGHRSYLFPSDIPSLL